jgi:hypothetical protein
MNSIEKPVAAPLNPRAYGGYSSEQEKFYREHLMAARPKSILDPMAGQGSLLSDLALEGKDIWLGDANPAPLLLATFRDPEALLQHASLSRRVRSLINRLEFPRGNRKAATEYVGDWLAQPIANGLRNYAGVLGLDSFASPIKYDSSFWSAPLELRFAAALPILAARELTTFKITDNIAWLKPGGLYRGVDLSSSLLNTLDRWVTFASSQAALMLARPVGRLSLRRMNPESGIFGDCPAVDAIVTSPPYANRLDYIKLWGPEIAVFSSLWNLDCERQLRWDQIGSTIVRNRPDAGVEERSLPSSVRKALTAIRTDRHFKASESYYYPFFRNYALSLTRSLRNVARQLRRNGILIVFVRDTIRKDVLFPTGDLVISTLVKSLGFAEVAREHTIIRAHIGLRRKQSTTGLYGLAQQEWWFVFRKRST